MKLVAKYGLYQVSQVLRLDYNSLKKHVESAGGENPAVAGAAATFLELPSPMSAFLPECVFELENRVGTKMRLHVKGAPATDLVAIGRSLWGNEA